MTRISRITDEPLTVAYIRDELRNNRYGGDLFDALRFMLKEYDTLNSKLKTYTKPSEYTVRMDVV